MRHARYEVFTGADGQWYWRLRAANGRIIAIGGEGFTRRESARRSARRVRVLLPTADVPE